MSEEMSEEMSETITHNAEFTVMHDYSRQAVSMAQM